MEIRCHITSRYYIYPVTQKVALVPTTCVHNELHIPTYTRNWLLGACNDDLGGLEFVKFQMFNLGFTFVPFLVALLVVRLRDDCGLCHTSSALLSF